MVKPFTFSVLLRSTGNNTLLGIAIFNLLKYFNLSFGKILGKFKILLLPGYVHTRMTVDQSLALMLKPRHYSTIA